MSHTHQPGPEERTVRRLTQPPAGEQPYDARRPLAVTADATLIDDLQRLAAAADAELAVVRDPGAARRLWPHAAFVLVGADVAVEMASTRPRRRGGVVLVTGDAGAAEPTIFRDAVGIGAQDIAVLPEAETWLVDRLAEAAEPVSREGKTVCVVGGRGGAGTSVLASALAVTAARNGGRALLIDGDPIGGGIDLVLGTEGCQGARWPEFIGRHGRLSYASLRASLPSVDELTVLSWHRGDTRSVPAETMRAVVSAARRGSDLVVLDLARYFDDAAVEALAQASLALLVVPAEVRAVAAASRVARALRRHVTDLRVVVRTDAGKLDIDAVARALGLPLAGAFRAEPRLARQLDQGLPPALSGNGPLAEFCRSFLDAASTRRAA